jgi:hypothetical protein
VGRIDIRGPLLTPQVGKTYLDDDRFGCSVEIIFATIRFCNSPYSNMGAASTPYGGPARHVSRVTAACRERSSTRGQGRSDRRPLMINLKLTGNTRFRARATPHPGTHD